MKRRRVYVSVVDGDGFLEKPRRIPGEHIPLIPVYGKRWFIDDIERVEGHIAKAMDPQRLYNLQVSMLADTAAQDPGHPNKYRHQACSQTQIIHLLRLSSRQPVSSHLNS